MPHRTPGRYHALIHRILLGIVGLALILAVVFGLRLATSATRWNEPAAPPQQIAGWMTPRYVARSWQVAPDVVAEALALERDGRGRTITLSELAAERGIATAALIETLSDAIATYKDQAGD